MQPARLKLIAFWTTMTSILVLALVTFMLALTWINRPFPGFVVLGNGSVDSIASARWSGFQHGIKQIDHITSVEGELVQNGRDIYRKVATYPVGTPLRYTLERSVGGKSSIVRLTIPSQRFTPFDFVGFFLTFWVVGVFHILMGLFVSLVKPGDRTAQAHLAFCIVFGTFAITNFDGISSHIFTIFPHNEMFALIGAFSTNLAFLVPRPLPMVQRFPWIRHVNLLVGLLFMAYIHYSFSRPEAWPLAFTLLTFVASGAILAIPIASLATRFDPRTTPQIRSQANIILNGALIAFFPAITVNALAIAGITVPGSEMTYFGMVIFPTAVAYTIVRHRLFNIEIIVKRTVTYALVTVALFTLYFVLTAGIRGLIGPRSSDLANIIATAVVAIAIAPMRDRSKKLVDRWFFRTSYDLPRLLTEFGDRARETFDAAHLLSLFVTMIKSALYPTYIAILLPDPASGRLALRESMGLETLDVPELDATTPTLEALLDAPITLEPVDLASFRHATLLPLRLKDELVGLVVVGPRKSDQAYTSSDRTLLVNLAQQLGLWVKNAELFGQLAGQARLKRELEIAHEVQTGLLPTSLASLPNLELAATSIPALEVGGDFYDVLPIDEHRLGILIGDVSGKGVPAALLMAMTLVIFRSIARDDLSAASVMQKANALINLNRPSRKMFVTAFYAIYDARDRSLTYANAGNPFPIGTAGRLEAKGMALGMFPSAHYEEETTLLAPGELIVLYSDGAEDAINASSEQFGVERLAEVIFANRKNSAQEVQDQILDTIRHFSEGADQFDDITLVALRAN